jgi:hypothetical protein
MHNTCCDNTNTEISQSFVRVPYALKLEKTTLTTEVKSSSKIIISELSLATSVPEIPIERPISAYITKSSGLGESYCMLTLLEK